MVVAAGGDQVGVCSQEALIVEGDMDMLGEAMNCPFGVV